MAHVLEKKWRSEDVKLQENADFSALLLSERVLEGLQKAGFKKPSPIQLEAIPVGRFGKDLMVQAKSGTGKTLVFVIIGLEMLKRKLFRPQIMIIVPTREIATQVCSVVKLVGSGFHKLTCNTFIGGLPLFEDQEKAVMTQIVVGTPGRLRQLIQLKSLPTNSIRLLIFDEADELLHSNSFKDDLEDIFTSLPDEKQIICTSATFNAKVKKIMFRYLSNPHLIRLNAKQLALLGMVHYAQVVEYCPLPVIMYKIKLDVLEKILKTIKFAQCLMFCNGIQRVEVLYRDVKRWGFSVAYISSAKEQCDRLKAIERLKRFKCKVLVSSDLTARGIDAENVDLVINFDLAYTTEIYMHRVGRAGRYGSIGVAISIIDNQEMRYLQRIEKEGSFKTFKLPDPVPNDLILYPTQEEFVIDEPVSGNVDDGTEAKQSNKSDDIWDRFNDNYCDFETEVNAQNIHANGISEINIDKDNAPESELATADDGDVENEDSEKEIVRNIQIKDIFDSCNGGDGNTIECASSQLAVDVKPQDDNTKCNEECENVDEVISHLNNTNIHLNGNAYVNNDSIKQNANINSNLLNGCDQNGLIYSESADKPADCNIHENSDFCDKNALEKKCIVSEIIETDTQLINQFSNMSSNLEKNDFEIDDNKLTKICTDNILELSEFKDIVKKIKDDSMNYEQVNAAKSCDILKNMIANFLDTFESNKIIESIDLEATFDKDSQIGENCGKEAITINMINSLKSQKHEFFHKILKKFQESKDGCSSSHENEKEDKKKSNEDKSKTDLLDEETVQEKLAENSEIENKEIFTEKSTLESIPLVDGEMVHEKLAENSEIEIKEIFPEKPTLESTPLVDEETVHEKLAENSEVENKEISPEKTTLESTPQLNHEIKQDIEKVTADKAACKPVIQNKLISFFQELSDDSELNEEISEIVNETSSSISSASDSLSSDSELSSSSSDSEDESSGSETQTSSNSSESSSDSSDSSSSTSSSENEDENVYHHNYSRTGRQNPSLVSGSARGQVLNDKVYYDKYFQDHRCTSCGGRKKEIPRYNVVGNPPYFFDHREISSCSRRGQNYADHNNTQSSVPRKHSRCHRYGCSSRNVAREGDESRNVFPTRRRSSRHNHTLNCFLPTGHRCHPDTPDQPCNQGPLCEMWYKTFYNQWLHIQSVIN